MAAPTTSEPVSVMIAARTATSLEGVPVWGSSLAIVVVGELDDGDAPTEVAVSPGSPRT